MSVARAMLALAAAVALAAAGACRRPAPVAEVRVLHAAGLAPYVARLRDACERDLHIVLRAEGSGSQEACRKVTELGRDADVLMLADAGLVKDLLGGVCRWRIDFATDALVLAVGARAPDVPEAEKDWAAVVARDGVRLARVDENLGPLGYRTLLALKLEEQCGATGLYDRVLARGGRVADDAERLVPLLKSGEVDYAFLYQSTCRAHGIRFIELDPRVNLGLPDGDYGGVEVSFAKRKSGRPETVTVRGAPIVWTLTQPRAAEDRAAGAAFAAYVASGRSAELAAVGLRPFPKPRFFGPAEVYPRFAEFADYGGELK